MKNYNIHEDQVTSIQDFIDNSLTSTCTNIIGKSGTGKTHLVKIALNKYFQHKNTVIIYLDLNNDILSNTSFWDIFLFTTWHGKLDDELNLLKLEKKDSLSYYMKKKNIGKKSISTFFKSIVSCVAVIPFYGAQLELGGFDSIQLENTNLNNNDFNKSNWVIKYLRNLAKSKKVILIIDNYQFMNKMIKVFLEQGINQINKNLHFINIQRNDNIEFSSPALFHHNQKNIELSLLKAKQIGIIFKEEFTNLSSCLLEEAVVDCYQKTLGNLKEIDLYIIANKDYIRKGIIKKTNTKNLIQMLDDLPQLQRDLVLIAALFPSGLRLKYVIKLIRGLFLLDDEIFLKELEKVITLGYVMLNSERKDLLKPTHDKIGLCLKPVNSTEEFMEFYNSIENSLEEIIKVKKHSVDYTYLLHCYVGICDSKRLLKNIKYLEHLILIKYQECSYFYLIELANTYLNNQSLVFLHLEKKIVLYLLDACQKTCAFQTSLNILKIINKNNDDEEYNIFKVKILTQLYKFDEALKYLENIPNSNEKMLYKLIILEHLGKNKEISKILELFLSNDNLIFDKWYYLILRNTAHFFPFKQALDNLNEALDYFLKTGTFFEQATIYNNLSVIQLWNGATTYKEAQININHSKELFNKIASNEIFESYYNHGVLCFLNKEYEEANKMFDLSLTEVPQTLTMDVALLNLNKKLTQLALKQIELIDIEVFILNKLNDRNILQDPWVLFQLEYNLRSIQKYNKGLSKIKINSYYLKHQSHTDMTVFTDIVLKESNLPVCLSLSPNWRY